MSAAAAADRDDRPAERARRARPRARTAPLLEVYGHDRAVRRADRAALRSISTVPAHSVVAVIGPNGSGKSTLFNAVTGLVTPDSGSVRFAGDDITRLPPHRVLDRGIARTFQNLRLFPSLTVLENVMIGRHARLSTGAFGALLRLPRLAARRGGGARTLPRNPRDLRQPPAAARRPRRVEPQLRQPAPGRDRPRAWPPARSCCCSTSRPPG